MKHFCRLALLMAIWMLHPAALVAQEGADDHAAVWSAVEALWEAAEKNDDGWVDAHLSADFVGWPADSPAPRSRASTRLWARFDAGQEKGLAHELYPLSIVVHGDMAIAHYLYTVAVQTKDRRTEVQNGRYTDVLVRDGSSWKFISWHGGAQP